jgi:hypothetical protein
MHRIPALLAAACLALALSACGSTNSGSLPPDWDALLNGQNQNGNNGNNNNGNNGNQTGNDIDITVSNLGATPTYTWTLGGGQSLTVVRQSDPGTPVWVIATPGRDGVLSGVVQGTVPSGAIEVVSTERTLTPGVPYRVTVARIATNNAGWKDFTP